MGEPVRKEDIPSTSTFGMPIPQQPLPLQRATSQVAREVLQQGQQIVGAPITGAQAVTSVQGVSAVEEAKQAEAASIACWNRLIEGTRHLSTPPLSSADAFHRFTNVSCSAPTAVKAPFGNYRYLHANHVGEGISDRGFVASQAPMSLGPFWAFVADSGGGIIDLTTEDDRKNGVFPYYPTEVGESMLLDDDERMKVELLSKKGRLCEYKVTDQQMGDTKVAKRYHCNTWKDFSAASLPLIDELVSLLKTEPFHGNNTVVHCRAGIGRTGTLIAAAILEEKISKGEVTGENLEETVQAIVLKLREQRGSGCVQTREQMNCIIDYGKWLLRGRR